MLAKWPIRYKLCLMLLLLLVLLTTLSAAGLWGLYSYRSMVKSMSRRANELPFATVLGQQVTDLRVTLTEIGQLHSLHRKSSQKLALDGRFPILSEQFGLSLQTFEQTLIQYRKQLTGNEWNSSGIGHSHAERQTANKIENILSHISSITRDPKWTSDEVQVHQIDEYLQRLQKSSVDLPSYLHTRMKTLADDVRIQYRTLIVTTWACILLATIMILLLVRLFIIWVFKPLASLIEGSRRVASGDFSHRIHLRSHDEMSELAKAMNDMTDRFQTICNNLDHKVKQNTIQMVRTEQLASVGFLAAGVAHEINNPMASIALCAESLEQRLDKNTVIDQEQADAVHKYLRMIQDEAFRCKEITARLLDFSRCGNGTEENTDLRDLVQGVVEMVRPLIKAQQKHIELAPCKSVIATVNPQEIKQVILNLITNAMDSIDSEGNIVLTLGICESMAEIVVSDNGCGMTEEVQQNLFEPFFTQRRGSQGTGLGLSIAYRIVEDHGGRLDAKSEGLERGSQFHVFLPLAGGKEKPKGMHYQAA